MEGVAVEVIEVDELEVGGFREALVEGFSEVFVFE